MRPPEIHNSSDQRSTGMVRRIYVDEALRSNPQRFVITADQLPQPSLTIPDLEPTPILTFFTIMEMERKALHVPVPRHSLNVAQFVAAVSAMTEGVELQQPGTQLPEHFWRFQDTFRKSGELSLTAFDMDNLTFANAQYSHLHGSIICSMLERSIIETIEKHGGLLASMGEENLVALPMSMENANIVITTILRNFLSIPFDFGNGEYHQGVSCGIASLSHTSPKTFRRLMELSGGALVYGKKNGKGVVTMFADREQSHE